jgi:uncharacterized membrane protein (UPF0127 family)
MTMKPAILKSVAGVMVVGVVLAFAVSKQQAQAADIAEVCNLTFTGNVQLRGVPVARTKAQQAKGLSNRDDVGPGMLFVFNPPGKLAFWMKDTRIPLSIAFMSSDGTLFAIEDMTPYSEKYHLSMKPAKYALELAQGQFQREGLAIGSRLLKEECRPME